MNPVLGIESSMFCSCGIVVAENPLLSSNFWILKSPMMNNSLFSDLLEQYSLDFEKENRKINRIEKSSI